MDKKKFCEMTNKLRLLYDRYEEVAGFLFEHGIRMDDNLFYGVMNVAVDAIADAVGDPDDWYDYFVNETNFGRNPREVQLFGDAFTIDTSGAAYDLIEAIKRKEEKNE